MRDATDAGATAPSRPPRAPRHDVVVRHARLRHGDRPDDGPATWSIGITGDRIDVVTPEPLTGAVEIDADGALVMASFVDAHLHLDKVHTWSAAAADARRAYAGDDMGAAARAISLASAVKRDYDETVIADRARRVLLDGLRHGVTHVRAFADTDTTAELHGVRPLLTVRDELADVVDVQVVAFPQDGVVCDDGAAEVVDEALHLGADLVGGIPWLEETDADADRHISAMLDLAVRHDVDVAMLTDDAGDPALATTGALATAAIDRGLAGRVTACHARALGRYPQPRLARLIRLARRAGMGFVTNPHTAPLALPVGALLDAGLPVALAQDDVADAYYPFGTHNLLEVALLTAHVLDMTSPAGMERLLDMVTTHAARVLRLPAHAVRAGAPANLVVLDGSDARAALARHAAPRHVISHGRPVASTTVRSELSLPASASGAPPDTDDSTPLTTTQEAHL